MSFPMKLNDSTSEDDDFSCSSNSYKPLSTGKYFFTYLFA